VLLLLLLLLLTPRSLHPGVNRYHRPDKLTTWQRKWCNKSHIFLPKEQECGGAWEVHKAPPQPRVCGFLLYFLLLTLP